MKQDVANPIVNRRVRQFLIQLLQMLGLSTVIFIQYGLFIHLVFLVVEFPKEQDLT
ncbi:hypothetical protein TNCV_3270481, partial [Trichonephila clavipes]